MIILALLLIAFALGYGVYSLQKVWGRSFTGAQRSWMVRMAIFGAGGLVLLGVLILPLPFKHRLLALVPAFFLIVAFLKVFKAGRDRLTRSTPAPEMDPMKRSP